MAEVCLSISSAGTSSSTEQALDEPPRAPPEHGLRNKKAGQPQWQIGLALNLVSGRVACNSGKHVPAQGQNEFEFDGDQHRKANVSPRCQKDEQLLFRKRNQLSCHPDSKTGQR